MEKFPITAEGHAILERELKHRLQVERPRIIQQIADARTDDSDLSENAEYHAAQELREANEIRIAELEDKLARVRLIETPGWRQLRSSSPENLQRFQWRPFEPSPPGGP
jgi:transcription elongation factor GreA